MTHVPFQITIFGTPENPLVKASDLYKLCNDKCMEKNEADEFDIHLHTDEPDLYLTEFEVFEILFQSTKSVLKKWLYEVFREHRLARFLKQKTDLDNTIEKLTRENEELRTQLHEMSFAHEETLYC